MLKCLLRFMITWFEFGLWDFWTIVMNELTYWQTDSCSQDLVVVSLVWHLVVKYAYYGVDYTKPTKCHRLGFWSWSVVKSLKLRCGWNFEAEVWSIVWSWGVFQILGIKTSQIHLNIPSLTNTWVLNLCHQYHLPEVHFWLLDWRREKEVLLKFI